MMLLNLIFSKCTALYNFINHKKKINPLMYIDDLKRFAEKEKELETLIQAARI